MFSLRTRAEPSPEAATEPEGGAEHARRCEAVRASGFFDGMWYLQTYPDVAAAGVDPLAHFIDYGSAEARSPGPGFNARWYLSQYADVRTSGLEPLFHFLWFGVQENRQPLPPRAQDAKGDVAEYWATERQGYLRSWLEHKVMLDFLHQRVSGDPKVENCEWFKRAYFAQPVKLALSLGCGFGPFERRAVQLGIAEKFHACDISPGAIKKATELAAEAGLSDKIEYSVRNVDELVLPENSYDAIFAISSAHHVFTLENLFIQCRRALKPGGLLFLDEYIGPTRFQSSPLVTDIINRVLAMLPPRYRMNLFTNDGSTIDRYAPSPIEVFEQNDPSEAIRSAEIITILKLYFDVVETRPYGGAILHMLFSGIMGNFDASNDADVTILRLLATFEQILEETGAIGSDFAAIVAKPRKTD